MRPIPALRDRLQGVRCGMCGQALPNPWGPTPAANTPAATPAPGNPDAKTDSRCEPLRRFSEASCSRQPGRRHGGFGRLRCAGRLGGCARRLRRCAGWPRCHGWSWWHGWPRWPGWLWGFGWLGWHGRPGWHGHGWPGRVRGSWWHDQPSSTDSWRDRSGNGRRDGAGSGHCRSSREHDAADDARPNLYVFYECQTPFP